MRQVLNVDSDNNAPAEISKAKRRYLQEKECVVESQQNDALGAPRGSSAVQTFPRHMAFILLQYFDNKDSLFYGMYLL